MPKRSRSTRSPSLDPASQPTDIPVEDAPTSLKLFLIFSRIGMTSFGGGLSGWLLREFVQDRHWVTEEAFLDGLSLSQAIPGINVKNMAIWLGYRLVGWQGAAAAVVGIILPPAIAIILLATIFSALLHFPIVHTLLAGAAAAATGLSLSMGVTTARRVPRRVIPLIFMCATFAAVGVLRLPLVWVVLGGGGVSVLIEYLKLRKT